MTAAASRAVLYLTKDPRAGLVRLSWRDGLPRFRVLRSLSRDLSADTTVAADLLAARAFDDAVVLADPNLWFYDLE